MTLLREIQAAATESNIEISTALRKARVLAARLKDPTFQLWVDQELNGYADQSGLPSYRVVPVEVQGHIARMGLHWNAAPIMTSLLPERFRVWGETCHLRQPIATIASLAASAKHGDQLLQVPWPQELAVKYGAKGYQGFECLGAWQVVSPHALIGVVDTVRNRLLEFALKIEAENPAAGEALPSSEPVPKEKLQMIVHNTFYGPIANLAQNSRDFTQKKL